MKMKLRSLHCLAAVLICAAALFGLCAGAEASEDSEIFTESCGF